MEQSQGLSVCLYKTRTLFLFWLMNLRSLMSEHKRLFFGILHLMCLCLCVTVNTACFSTRLFNFFFLFIFVCYVLIVCEHTSTNKNSLTCEDVVADSARCIKNFYNSVTRTPDMIRLAKDVSFDYCCLKQIMPIKTPLIMCASYVKDKIKLIHECATVKCCYDFCVTKFGQ